MTVRYEFEAHKGYRFTKDDVSILVHAQARFKEGAIVTNSDIFNFFRAMNRFLESVDVYDHEHQQVEKLMRLDDFPDLADAPFYKFVPNDALEYYQAGSFQFGSIQYYRDIEKQSSRDAMEGLANIAFRTPKHIWAMSLVSGYNFGILCGTSSIERREAMSAKFGPNIIKINNLRAFAEQTAGLLGAKRCFFNHIRYNDLKLFRTRTLNPLSLSDKSSGSADPALVSDAVFNLLYRDSFLPSLFMKPSRFSDENELRLVFEMPADIPRVLKVTDARLLNHIEFLKPGE